MCISDLILDRCSNISVAYVNNALLDLTLIKLIVASFVGAGIFLIRYSVI